MAPKPRRGSSDEHQLPIPGYDRLKEKEIAGRLSQLSQVELATVEAYERVLPTSRASAGEERVHEEKAALLREGYADRERTAPDPSG